MEGCQSQQTYQGGKDDKMKIKVFGNDKNEKFTINQIKMIEMTREFDKGYEI